MTTDDEDVVAETRAMLRTLATVLSFVFLALVGGYIGARLVLAFTPL